MCDSQLLWQCSQGKGCALCGSSCVFFFIGVIAAKYWEGKMDFGYGRGRKLDALNPVSSGF